MTSGSRSKASESERQVNIAEFSTPYYLKSETDEPVYCPQITDSSEKTAFEVGSGSIFELQWRQPRDVCKLFVLGPALPKPSQVEVFWWYRIWPDGGTGGWQRLDDPFNGEWIKVAAESVKEGGALCFTFKPLDKIECPKSDRGGFEYRRTYKMRVVFHAAATVDEIQCYTGAVWKEASLRLDWKPKAERPVVWEGRIEGINAHILSVEPEGRSDGPVTVNLRYSSFPRRLSEDRGIVVFHAPGWDSFSVFVDDVIREGGVYVRDIDAFVSDGSKDIKLAGFYPMGEVWDTTITGEVALLPEQSMEQVMRAMPAKPLREAHLGVPNMRQEFTITDSGNIDLYSESLRAPGKDLDRRTWNGNLLRYALSTLSVPVFDDQGGRSVKRFLEDNCLPVIHTEWENEGLKFHQQAFATNLIGTIGEPDGVTRKADDSLVLLDKIEIENPGKRKAVANVWIELTYKTPMTIDKDGFIRLSTATDGSIREGLTPTRGRIDINDKGTLSVVPDCVPAEAGSPELDSEKIGRNPREVIRYTVELAGGEKHSIYLAIPYVELLDDDEVKAVKKISFEKEKPKVLKYWNSLIERGMAYEVPEKILCDLWKANLWHVLITTDQDPFTGLYEHGAATMHYAVFANETAMVAQSLEMRGEHEEALRLLLPFLKCQGVRPLPGNFKTQDGLMYSAHPVADPDPYTAQGYNMHHGWAMWKLAEHYKYTRDDDWLKSISKNLVDACDWVTRERKATMVMNPDGSRPIEYGLAPAGDLEDVEEFLYFYATNAYYYVGMKTVADVLGQIGDAEARRLASDAEAYKADILASLRAAVAESPVVRLKDGNWVPYVPARAYQVTHQKEGWIREGLYSALHILDCGLVEPNHPLIGWILDDLEDNIFMSKESGYGVADQKANFFNFGGFNLQPNLLPNIMAHLMRDEIPHFIRVFYNMCWASLWPDTMCFAEWVPYYGKGGGPLYKTPDESKFIQYMRYMLVFEDGDCLKLGMAVPRKWMEDGKVISIQRAATFFGKMDLKIVSKAKQGRIEAEVRLPTRNAPKTAFLRLRHYQGKPMARVTIDGKDWKDFDAAKELVALPVSGRKIKVVASY